jgi:GNAT superfamily N-acetyltransferase
LIVIRRVEARDLERLEAGYPEPGRPTSRHRQRWALQRRAEGVYLIAWHEDAPIGWVFVHRPGSSEASEHSRRLEVAEIVDLQVAEPFRGRGYGASLLTSAEQLARESGWGLIGLEVTVSNPHNDVARAMYERHGYTDAGLGEFESGSFFWTESGERRWEGEPHRYLVKSLIDTQRPVERRGSHGGG